MSLFKRLLEKSYVITDENLVLMAKEMEEILTLELTITIRNSIAIEIKDEFNCMKNAIESQRKEYAALEERYIKVLQNYEILLSKQLMNKNLASEIFGDDVGE